MDFETEVFYDGNYYVVSGVKVVIDSSFAHAFGIERGFHYAVENLKIWEAYDQFGNNISFDNSKKLVNKLTDILEYEFNEG